MNLLSKFSEDLNNKLNKILLSDFKLYDDLNESILEDFIIITYEYYTEIIINMDYESSLNNSFFEDHLKIYNQDYDISCYDDNYPCQISIKILPTNDILHIKKILKSIIV
jgi:hypothetical protein